jgi:hypothetical protein
MVAQWEDENTEETNWTNTWPQVHYWAAPRKSQVIFWGVVKIQHLTNCASYAILTSMQVAHSTQKASVAQKQHACFFAYTVL